MDKDKAINNLSRDEFEKFVKTLSDDETKIRYLDEFDNELYKCLIIKSLSNDELKIQYLNKFNDEKYKCSIIESLSSD